MPRWSGYSVHFPKNSARLRVRGPVHCGNTQSAKGKKEQGSDSVKNSDVATPAMTEIKMYDPPDET